MPQRSVFVDSWLDFLNHIEKQVREERKRIAGGMVFVPEPEGKLNDAYGEILTATPTMPGFDDWKDKG